MRTGDRVLGVDYADDVELAYGRGELGDTPLIESIMDDAVAAGMTHVAWRVSHVGKLTYRTRVGTPQDGHQALRPSLTPFGLILQRCDPLQVAVEAAHRRGLKLLFYLTLFDECYQDPAGPISESWLGAAHPEYYSRHYSHPLHVRGVFSFAYAEVCDYFLGIVREGLEAGCDGVYLDVARTHAGANPIPVHGWWPQWSNPYLAYGYNDPDRARYRERYGEDPPVIHVTSSDSLEPDAAEVRWNDVRGEALTNFLRQVRPLARQYQATVSACFFPSTYNGFNPGYHCRQMLGRFQVDWKRWVDEDLIDAIRLNVDHRRFGYDDWQAASRQTFGQAQERGVKLYLDCAIEGRYDQMEDPPAPLPITKADQPELFFELMGDMARRMLESDADGVVYYEHAGNDARTWKALRAVHAGG
jgi:hypothetical protein